MRNSSSSRLSLPPSRFFWISSTVRMGSTPFVRQNFGQETLPYRFVMDCEIVGSGLGHIGKGAADSEMHWLNRLPCYEQRHILPGMVGAGCSWIAAVVG